MTKFMKTIRWPVLQKYFRKLVEIILKGTYILCANYEFFIFEKEIFVNLVIQKLLRMYTVTSAPGIKNGNFI